MFYEIMFGSVNLLFFNREWISTIIHVDGEDVPKDSLGVKELPMFSLMSLLMKNSPGSSPRFL